jgi:hypothetical protein
MNREQHKFFLFGKVFVTLMKTTTLLGPKRKKTLYKGNTLDLMLGVYELYYGHAKDDTNAS